MPIIYGENVSIDTQFMHPYLSFRFCIIRAAHSATVKWIEYSMGAESEHHLSRSALASALRPCCKKWVK